MAIKIDRIMYHDLYIDDILIAVKKHFFKRHMEEKMAACTSFLLNVL